MELKKTQLTFDEMACVVRDAVDACFKVDDDGNDIEFRPELKDVSLQCSFYENYIGLPLRGDFDEAFATYMAVDIDDCIFNKSQWYAIRNSINEKIEFRKQQMLNNKKSASDEMYSMITTLLATLNEKAEKLDPKKFEKVLNKLNPNEIVKAYQKSNIGDGVRDKTIQEQAKEIQNLKNEISARNVKVVK